MSANPMAQRVIRFSEVFTLTIILLYILILWPGRTDSFWFSYVSLGLFTLATIIAFLIIITSFLQYDRVALQGMLAFFIVSIALSGYAYWVNGIVDPYFLAVIVLAVIGAAASCAELRLLSHGNVFSPKNDASSTQRMGKESSRQKKASSEAVKERAEDGMDRAEGEATSARRRTASTSRAGAKNTSRSRSVSTSSSKKRTVKSAEKSVEKTAEKKPASQKGTRRKESGTKQRTSSSRTRTKKT